MNPQGLDDVKPALVHSIRCLQLGANLSTDGAAAAVQGPEYQAAFFNVLPRSLKHAMKHFDEAARGKVNRLVAVWDERKARTPHSPHSTPCAASACCMDVSTPSSSLCIIQNHLLVIKTMGKELRLHRCCCTI